MEIGAYLLSVVAALIGTFNGAFCGSNYTWTWYKECFCGGAQTRGRGRRILFHGSKCNRMPYKPQLCGGAQTRCGRRAVQRESDASPDFELALALQNSLQESNASSMNTLGNFDDEQLRCAQRESLGTHQVPFVSRAEERDMVETVVSRRTRSQALISWPPLSSSTDIFESTLIDGGFTHIARVLADGSCFYYCLAFCLYGLKSNLLEFIVPNGLRLTDFNLFESDLVDATIKSIRTYLANWLRRNSTTKINCSPLDTLCEGSETWESLIGNPTNSNNGILELTENESYINFEDFINQFVLKEHAWAHWFHVAAASSAFAVDIPVLVGSTTNSYSLIIYKTSLQNNVNATTLIDKGIIFFYRSGHFELLICPVTIPHELPEFREALGLDTNHEMMTSEEEIIRVRGSSSDEVINAELASNIENNETKNDMSGFDTGTIIAAEVSTISRAAEVVTELPIVGGLNSISNVSANCVSSMMTTFEKSSLTDLLSCDVHNAFLPFVCSLLLTSLKSSSERVDVGTWFGEADVEKYSEFLSFDINDNQDEHSIILQHTQSLFCEVVLLHIINDRPLFEAANTCWQRLRGTDMMCCGTKKSVEANQFSTFLPMCPIHPKRCALLGYTFSDMEFDMKSFDAAVKHCSNRDLYPPSVPSIGLCDRIIYPNVNNPDQILKPYASDRCTKECFSEEGVSCYNQYNMIVQSLTFALCGVLDSDIMLILHNAVDLGRNERGVQDKLTKIYPSSPLSEFYDFRTNSSLPYMSLLCTLLQVKLFVVFGDERPEDVLEGWRQVDPTTRDESVRAGGHGAVLVPFHDLEYDPPLTAYVLMSGSGVYPYPLLPETTREGNNLLDKNTVLSRLEYVWPTLHRSVVENVTRRIATTNAKEVWCSSHQKSTEANDDVVGDEGSSYCFGGVTRNEDTERKKKTCSIVFRDCDSATESCDPMLVSTYVAQYFEHVAIADDDLDGVNVSSHGGKTRPRRLTGRPTPRLNIAGSQNALLERGTLEGSHKDDCDGIGFVFALRSICCLPPSPSGMTLKLGKQIQSLHGHAGGKVVTRKSDGMDVNINKCLNFKLFEFKACPPFQRLDMYVVITKESACETAPQYSKHMMGSTNEPAVAGRSLLSTFRKLFDLAWQTAITVGRHRLSMDRLPDARFHEGTHCSSDHVSLTMGIVASVIEQGFEGLSGDDVYVYIRNVGGKGSVGCQHKNSLEFEQARRRIMNYYAVPVMEPCSSYDVGNSTEIKIKEDGIGNPVAAFFDDRWLTSVFGSCNRVLHPKLFMEHAVGASYYKPGKRNSRCEAAAQKLRVYDETVKRAGRDKGKSVFLEHAISPLAYVSKASLVAAPGKDTCESSLISRHTQTAVALRNKQLNAIREAVTTLELSAKLNGFVPRVEIVANVQYAKDAFGLLKRVVDDTDYPGVIEEVTVNTRYSKKYVMLDVKEATNLLICHLYRTWDMQMKLWPKILSLEGVTRREAIACQLADDLRMYLWNNSFHDFFSKSILSASGIIDNLGRKNTMALGLDLEDKCCVGGDDPLYTFQFDVIAACKKLFQRGDQTTVFQNVTMAAQFSLEHIYDEEYASRAVYFCLEKSMHAHFSRTGLLNAVMWTRPLTAAPPIRQFSLYCEALFPMCTVAAVNAMERLNKLDISEAFLALFPDTVRSFVERRQFKQNLAMLAFEQYAGSSPDKRVRLRQAILIRLVEYADSCVRESLQYYVILALPRGKNCFGKGRQCFSIKRALCTLVNGWAGTFKALLDESTQELPPGNSEMGLFVQNMSTLACKYVKRDVGDNFEEAFGAVIPHNRRWNQVGGRGDLVKKHDPMFAHMLLLLFGSLSEDTPLLRSSWANSTLCFTIDWENTTDIKCLKSMQFFQRPHSVRIRPQHLFSSNVELACGNRYLRQRFTYFCFQTKDPDARRLLNNVIEHKAASFVYLALLEACVSHVVKHPDDFAEAVLFAFPHGKENEGSSTWTCQYYQSRKLHELRYSCDQAKLCKAGNVDFTTQPDNVFFAIQAWCSFLYVWQNITTANNGEATLSDWVVYLVSYIRSNPGEAEHVFKLCTFTYVKVELVDDTFNHDTGEIMCLTQTEFKQLENCLILDKPSIDGDSFEIRCTLVPRFDFQASSGRQITKPLTRDDVRNIVTVRFPQSLADSMWLDVAIPEENAQHTSVDACGRAVCSILEDVSEYAPHLGNVDNEVIQSTIMDINPVESNSPLSSYGHVPDPSEPTLHETYDDASDPPFGYLSTMEYESQGLPSARSCALSERDSDDSGSHSPLDENAAAATNLVTIPSVSNGHENAVNGVSLTSHMQLILVGKLRQGGSQYAMNELEVKRALLHLSNWSTFRNKCITLINERAVCLTLRYISKNWKALGVTKTFVQGWIQGVFRRDSTIAPWLVEGSPRHDAVKVSLEILLRSYPLQRLQGCADYEKYSRDLPDWILDTFQVVYSDDVGLGISHVPNASLTDNMCVELQQRHQLTLFYNGYYDFSPSSSDDPFWTFDYMVTVDSKSDLAYSELCVIPHCPWMLMNCSPGQKVPRSGVNRDQTLGSYLHYESQWETLADKGNSVYDDWNLRCLTLRVDQQQFVGLFNGVTHSTQLPQHSWWYASSSLSEYFKCLKCSGSCAGQKTCEAFVICEECKRRRMCRECIGQINIPWTCLSCAQSGGHSEGMDTYSTSADSSVFFKHANDGNVVEHAKRFCCQYANELRQLCQSQAVGSSEWSKAPIISDHEAHVERFANNTMCAADLLVCVSDYFPGTKRLLMMYLESLKEVLPLDVWLLVTVFDVNSTNGPVRLPKLSCIHRCPQPPPKESSRFMFMFWLKYHYYFGMLCLATKEVTIKDASAMSPSLTAHDKENVKATLCFVFKVFQFDDVGDDDSERNEFHFKWHGCVNRQDAGNTCGPIGCIGLALDMCFTSTVRLGINESVALNAFACDVVQSKSLVFRRIREVAILKMAASLSNCIVKGSQVFISIEDVEQSPTVVRQIGLLSHGIVLCGGVQFAAINSILREDYQMLSMEDPFVIKPEGSSFFATGMIVWNPERCNLHTQSKVMDAMLASVEYVYVFICPASELESTVIRFSYKDNSSLNAVQLGFGQDDQLLNNMQSAQDTMFEHLCSIAPTPVQISPKPRLHSRPQVGFLTSLFSPKEKGGRVATFIRRGELRRGEQALSVQVSKDMLTTNTPCTLPCASTTTKAAHSMQCFLNKYLDGSELNFSCGNDVLTWMFELLGIPKASTSMECGGKRGKNFALLCCNRGSCDKGMESFSEGAFKKVGGGRTALPNVEKNERTKRFRINLKRTNTRRVELKTSWMCLRAIVVVHNYFECLGFVEKTLKPPACSPGQKWFMDLFDSFRRGKQTIGRKRLFSSDGDDFKAFNGVHHTLPLFDESVSSSSEKRLFSSDGDDFNAFNGVHHTLPLFDESVSSSSEKETVFLSVDHCTTQDTEVDSSSTESDRAVIVSQSPSPYYTDLGTTPSFTASSMENSTVIECESDTSQGSESDRSERTLIFGSNEDKSVSDRSVSVYQPSESMSCSSTSLHKEESPKKRRKTTQAHQTHMLVWTQGEHHIFILAIKDMVKLFVKRLFDEVGKTQRSTHTVEYLLEIIAERSWNATRIDIHALKCQRNCPCAVHSVRMTSFWKQPNSNSYQCQLKPQSNRLPSLQLHGAALLYRLFALAGPRREVVDTLQFLQEAPNPQGFCSNLHDAVSILEMDKVTVTGESSDYFKSASLKLLPDYVSLLCKCKTCCETRVTVKCEDETCLSGYYAASFVKAKRLGEGCTGVVYKGHFFNRTVAIKVVCAKQGRQEMEMMWKIGAPCFDMISLAQPVGTDIEPYFGLVMPQYSGRGILSANAGSITKDMVVSLLQQLLTAHDNGVVHNDVHSGNVIVSENTLFILDWGHAFKVKNRMVQSNSTVWLTAEQEFNARPQAPLLHVPKEYYEKQLRTTRIDSFMVAHLIHLCELKGLLAFDLRPHNLITKCLSQRSAEFYKSRVSVKDMLHYFLVNPVVERNAKSYLSAMKSIYDTVVCEFTASCLKVLFEVFKQCCKTGCDTLRNQFLVDGNYVSIICFKYVPVCFTYIPIMLYLLLRSDPFWDLERKRFTVFYCKYCYSLFRRCLNF